MRWGAKDIERYEVESQHSIAWVVRTRPDLMWSCALPALATWHVGREVAWLFRDFVGLYSRGVGLRALQLVDCIAAVDGCASSGHGAAQEPNLCLGAVMDESKAAWCELLTPGHSAVAYILRSATHAQRPAWAAGEQDDCPCTMCAPQVGGPRAGAAGLKVDELIQMGGFHVRPNKQCTNNTFRPAPDVAQAYVGQDLRKLHVLSQILRGPI